MIAAIFLLPIITQTRLSFFETDGIGAASARNLGATKASGEFLIFCDAHLQFEDLWIDHIVEPLLTGKSDAVTPAIASVWQFRFHWLWSDLKVKPQN
ncbi:glycosyltransferase [Peribacillus frigoritolerans]|nr:glycosyltransferase [Peribacillus frigoritolerans]